jgi:predicted nucleic acid-binding protein
MAYNIYFDTNIFLNLLDTTRPFAKASVTLFRELLEEGKTVYINSDTVTTAFYVMSRARRYPPEELCKFFQKLVSLFMIVPVENSEVMDAFSLCADPGNPYEDYEDTLQYICAKKIGAEFIVTNDQSFVELDIEVRSVQ